MKHLLTDNPAPKYGAGFTLIELLIAVSIIVMLSVLALTGYQAVYKSSRDAKRQSDLKFIQSALEEYHADNIAYPSTITPGSALVAGTKTYMTKVPSDPLSGNSDYSYVASGTSYCLYAAFEGTNIPTSDPGCTPTPPYSYGVTRP